MKRIALLLPFAISVAACQAPANAADAPAQAALPITRVTLYTSGVGYFERAGKIDGDASVPLNFQVGQINDVLKSLILLDFGGGSIRPVTYAAKDPVTKQLQAFSVDLSDNPDRATIFNRLRGANVTVTYTPPKAASSLIVTGIVMGVESKQQISNGPDGTRETVSILNILAADGIHGIPFGTIEGIKINDAALEAELRNALLAVSQGRDANKRPVTLSFAGKGRRDVLVGYVNEAPVWQTSYRLLIGKSSTLQGWGLVQNTTQEDWSNVGLTLVSGRPVSFVQDLYTPLYIRRPVIASRIAAAVGPVAYDGNLENYAIAVADNLSPQSPPSRRVGVMSKATAASPAMAPAPMVAEAAGGNGVMFDSDKADRALKQTMGATGARLGEALFTYSIPVPVSVPRQQSAMIPFLAATISAQKVGIYNQSVNASHPMNGARLKNTSGMHLLGGPITVFEDNGATNYAGDAIIDDTQPGETRLISYGVDIPVVVESKPGSSSGRYLGFRIVKGVLTTMSRTEQATIYTIKNNGELDQTIVVEHPYSGDEWKLLEPAKPTERTAAVYRFDVAAPATKSTELKVRQSRVNWQTYGIADIDIDTLLVFARDGAASDDVKAALTEAASRRRKVADAENRLNATVNQIDTITQGQSRIRENMKVLDKGSTLYKRYAGELDTQETQLVDLMSRRDAQQQELNKLRNDLADYIANLTVGDLPTVG
ncbi:MAG TPA: DUF4139 domain-containing protein [Capsulimonadaceae bacterium]|jgi:hypothetical protein